MRTKPLGCTVAPGFDFRDFAFVRAAELRKLLPADRYAALQRFKPKSAILCVMASKLHAKVEAASALPTHIQTMGWSQAPSYLKELTFFSAGGGVRRRIPGGMRPM